MSDAADDQISKAARRSEGGGGGSSGLFTEVGRTGVRAWGGYIYDDDDPRLRGLAAVKLYREMSKDPTGAAILFALTCLLRSAAWRIDAAGKDEVHEEAREFAESVLFKDMDHPWEDFVADAATMLPYGFAPMEMVYRKRNGTPEGADPVTGGSLYRDGRIGLKKVALRSQDTVQRWDLDPDTDELRGVYQLDPVRGREMHIPVERLVLLRTTPNRGNPEGESILRGAVRPYQRKREIELAEGSMAIRASGLVVVNIPQDAYRDPTTRAQWESLAKEVADDRAGFMLMPTLTDKEGKAVPAYDVKYMVADGRRSADMGPIITRLQREIATTVLADFIMLGQEGKGSFALSQDKTELFAQAVLTFLRVIKAAANRIIIPRVWAVNGLPRDTMPTAETSDLEKPDLRLLGGFVTSLIASGGVMDEELENALREKANLPLRPKAEVETSPPAAPPAKSDVKEEAGEADAGGGEPPSPPFQRKPVAAGAEVQKAEDVAALASIAADDPAYREALAVIAGGPIPQGVDIKDGGAPGEGQFPFPCEVGKGWNPAQPRDHLGRFASASGAAIDLVAVGRFLESGATGRVTVAVLPADIQAHFEAATDRVLLSSDTRDTHHHHKWSVDDLARLQKLLDHGEIREDRDLHIVAAHHQEKWWMATLKVTGDRKEVYLQTLHRSNNRQVRKFREKGKLVRSAVGS